MNHDAPGSSLPQPSTYSIFAHMLIKAKCHKQTTSAWAEVVSARLGFGFDAIIRRARQRQRRFVFGRRRHLRRWHLSLEMRGIWKSPPARKPIRFI